MATPVKAHVHLDDGMYMMRLRGRWPGGGSPASAYGTAAPAPPAGGAAGDAAAGWGGYCW
jgi:hypothetical protein